MLIGRGFCAICGPGVAAGGTPDLDSPINNFDVAGIPTGSWSSGLFGCLENIFPSCVLSFFCPCVMFSQVVVRAQVPLFISLKNSLACFRRQSGYGVFIDFYFWTAVLAAGSMALLILFPFGSAWYVVAWAVCALFVWLWCYANAHLRMAVREKYDINPLPPFNRRGGLLEWLADSTIAVLCLPCSLSQLARHVFQYDRWDPPIGLLSGDPTSLAPLEEGRGMHRPQRADAAGLSTISTTYGQARTHRQGGAGAVTGAGESAEASYPVAQANMVQPALAPATVVANRDPQQ